jgi:hypothetical protein
MQSERGESARKNVRRLKKTAARIQIRGTPVAEFGNFLKLLTNPSTLFM